MNHLPWTPAEDAILVARYISEGSAACAAATGRTVSAVCHRARDIGLVRLHRWTYANDLELEAMWGEHSLRAVAAKLGRTEASVYWRARELDLEVGAPQGYEYLTDAAERTGYGTGQLRRVLAFARVRIRRAVVRPGMSPKGVHVHHYVAPELVDAAIARWCDTEPLETAARRLGITGELLARMLRAAGVSLRVGGGKRHRRVSSADLARAIAHRGTTERVAEAARRVGVRRSTLGEWLVEAGVREQGSRARVAKVEVDRVVAERRARATSRAPGRERRAA